MKILITGAAGFIGSHLCEKLLLRGDEVYGLDNINSYYTVDIKQENLDILNKFSNFHFVNDDLITTNIISQITFDCVVNLGAMAGVRHSLKDPELYVKTNILGQVHLLEECVKNNVKAFIYASSSSVYGLNKKVPFVETDSTNTPNNPYAVSKLTGEIFAKMYSQLYNISTIGLRFFTVYGNRGSRPDMAPYKFIYSIHNGIPFDKFGTGHSKRDYTYVGDIVNGIVGAIDNKNNIKCEVYNLGNSNTVSLNEFISTCEKVVGKKAIYIQHDDQPGDVQITYADCTKAKNDLGYIPETTLFDGLTSLYEWIKSR